MSFLNRGTEDASSDGNEELYRELFAKIGRDFVYKEDLRALLVQLITAMSPMHLPLVLGMNDVLATRRAREYKRLLDEGDTDKKYRDLINLDDD